MLRQTMLIIMVLVLGLLSFGCGDQASNPMTPDTEAVGAADKRIVTPPLPAYSQAYLQGLWNAHIHMDVNQLWGGYDLLQKAPGSSTFEAFPAGWAVPIEIEIPSFAKYRNEIDQMKILLPLADQHVIPHQATILQIIDRPAKLGLTITMPQDPCYGEEGIGSHYVAFRLEENVTGEIFMSSFSGAQVEIPEEGQPTLFERYLGAELNKPDRDVLVLDSDAGTIEYDENDEDDGDDEG